MKNAANTINGFIQQFHNDHHKRHKMMTVLLVLSLVVVLGVFYQLRLTALTLAGEADCGYVEHVHSEECIQRTLVCTDTSEEHVHTEDCYVTEYICGFEESYEHVHTVDCYADDSADVETAAIWEASVKDVELTGDWDKDLIEIAKSQIGYAESTKNWQADEEHIRRGYTRYGAWYSNPYGEWDSMFVSFCMNFADIPEEEIPRNSGAYSWSAALAEKGLYCATEGYNPSAGDIVFFDNDADGKADRAGIVAEIIEETSESAGLLRTIEGDLYDAVSEAEYIFSAGSLQNITINDGSNAESTILGYCNTAGICASYNERIAAAGQTADAEAADEATADSETIESAAKPLQAPQAKRALSEMTPSEIVAAIDDYTYEELWTYINSLTDDDANAFFDALTEEEQNKLMEVLNQDNQVMPLVSSNFDTNVEYEVTATNAAWSSQQAAGNKLWVNKVGSTDKTLAYCYNGKRAIPGVSDVAISPYYKAKNVDESVFVEEAQGEEVDKPEEWIKDSNGNPSLKRTILSIVYNGYPKNSSDLLNQNSSYTVQIFSLNGYKNLNIYGMWNEMGSLYQSIYTNIDQFFYAATQIAIWHFTDQISYSSYTSATSGWPFAVYAAQIIVQAAKDNNAPESNELDLFSTNQRNSNGQYQDVLTVTQVDPDPEPETDSYKASITVRKTLDGSAPSAGAYTFALYDASGTKIKEASNDASGNVTFGSITYTEPGVYKYTVKEIIPDNPDTSIDYDTSELPVTVTVRRETDGIQTTISSIGDKEIIGWQAYNDGTYVQNQRTITIGGSPYRAYCINKSGGEAKGAYDYIADPSSEELADAVASDTTEAYKNYGGTTLSENMRKVVYNLSHGSFQPGKTIYYYDLNGNTTSYTMTEDSANQIVWLLSGDNVDDTTNKDIYEALLRNILRSGEDAPSNYHLILFAGNETGLAYDKQQPVVIGYTTETGDTVERKEVSKGLYGSQSTVPVFQNETKPETDDIHITAKKVMSDGSSPTEGAYTFKLYENDKEIDEATNGTGGTITFTKGISVADAKSKTYTVKEVAGSDSSVSYDANVYTITFNYTTTTETKTVIENFEKNKDAIIGYESTKDSNHRTVTVGDTPYTAYCINRGKGTANGNYGYIVSPTAEELGEQVVADYIGKNFTCGVAGCTSGHGDLAEVMRKVVYYFSDDAHKYESGKTKYIDDANGNSIYAITNNTADDMVWMVSGHSGYWDVMDNPPELSLTSYKERLHAVLTWAEKNNIPDSFKLVLFTGNEITAYHNQQPVVIGVNTTTESTRVTETTAATQTNPPTFTNTKTPTEPPTPEPSTEKWTHQIEATKYLGDTSTPSNVEFEFDLYKSNADGDRLEAVQENVKNSTTDGKIVFDAINFTSPGTYYYVISEHAKDGYTTAADQLVTITVTKGTSQEIKQLEKSDLKVTSRDNDTGVRPYKLKLADETQLDAWCIDATNKNLTNCNYEVTINPDNNAVLKNTTSEGKYLPNNSSEIKEDLMKAMIVLKNEADSQFENKTHYSDTLGYFYAELDLSSMGATGNKRCFDLGKAYLNSSGRDWSSKTYDGIQYYIWWLTGGQSNDNGYDYVKKWVDSEWEKLDSKDKNATMVLYASTDGGQPMAAVYKVSESTSSYMEGSQTTASFVNHPDTTEKKYETTFTVNKLLNGAAPGSANIFTFVLRDKSDGTEVARAQNDADGTVTFNVSFSKTGTYDYYIEEIDEGQGGVDYDTKKIYVRINVSETGTSVTPTPTAEEGEELKKINDNLDDLVGKSVLENSSYHYYITPGSETAVEVYPLNFTSSLTEETFTASEPTTIASYSASDLKNVLVYLKLHPDESAEIERLTLNFTNRKNIARYMIGNYSTSSTTFANAVEQMKSAGAEYADKYTLKVFTSSYQYMAQVFEGVSRTSSGGGSSQGTTTTTPVYTVNFYSDEAYTQTVATPTFENTKTQRSLPETGGVGAAPIVIGFMLMASPFIYLGLRFINSGSGLRRRRERRLKK